jgi:DNA ligase (NAD+)
MREEREVAVRCIGLDCPAQVQERIRHFASRAAMDIEGLGEKNVELLYSRGLIGHFIDIYRIKNDDLLQLPRFAEKSAQNLIDAIERSKHATLSKFLYALGILHVGEYAAKLLSENFERLEDLYNVKPERIMEVRHIGEKIAQSVADFFNDPENLRTIEKLKTLGLKITSPDFKGKRKEKRSLDGLTFVITGSLPKPRKEVENMIEALGGHTSSSVSRSTDYLVFGEEPGSKLQKAKSLGVKTISYVELLKIIEEKKK